MFMGRPIDELKIIIGNAAMADQDQKDKSQSISLYSLPGHLIRRCNQISIGLFFDEMADYKITPIQYAILALLSKNGEADQITLAGCAAVNRTTMGDVADRLETRNLIARKINPADRRVKLLAITEKGTDLLDEIDAHVNKVQERLLQPLCLEEREVFIEMLKRVVSENNEWSRAPLKGL